MIGVEHDEHCWFTNKPRVYDRCGLMCVAGSHNEPGVYDRCGT